MDTEALADVVLRLVSLAGGVQGSRPWLAALALPDAEGEPRRQRGGKVLEGMHGDIDAPIE